MHHPSFARLAPAVALLGLCGAACRSSEGPSAPGPSAPAAVEPLETYPETPAALVLDGTAFDTALKVTLPPESPEEYEGLHNVFHLSPNIVSGSEPHGAEALVELQKMGVRTILSVDGKVPDGEAAAKLGMRYVHIPIQYKGVTQAELGEISKTFRELEGPFYVHCFHGKHRGPAAAAVGRIVLDGADRQTAIAEMRQYCGTASKYEGLYHDIATAHIPTAAETRALDFDFAAKRLPEGIVGLMVPISRANDNLDALDKRSFAVDPEHPDVDPAQEARILLQSFEAALELDEVKNGAADYRGWFQAAHDDSAKLVDSLLRLEDGDAAAAAETSKNWAAVKASCTACHKAYRD